MVVNVPLPNVLWESIALETGKTFEEAITMKYF